MVSLNSCRTAVHEGLSWCGSEKEMKFGFAQARVICVPVTKHCCNWQPACTASRSFASSLVLLLQPVHSECCCFLGGSYLRGGKGPHLCQCWTNFCFCFEWSNVPFCRWGFQCHVMFRSLTFFLIKVMQSKSEGFCAGNMGAQQWQRDVVDYFFLCV